MSVTFRDVSTTLIQFTAVSFVSEHIVTHISKVCYFVCIAPFFVGHTMKYLCVLRCVSDS